MNELPYQNEDGSWTTADITIREDFRDLIPPLSPAELDQLHNSLCAHLAARDPLVVWKEKNILLDGHNRYAYCKQHGLKFTVTQVRCSSDEEARRFIILNQLGRRNLAPDAMAHFRGMLYNGKKGEQGGDRKSEKSKGNSCTLPTAKEIAESTGVSERTIKNDGKFAEAVETLGIEKEVIAGTEKRSRKEIIATAAAAKPKTAKKVPQKPGVPHTETTKSKQRVKDAKRSIGSLTQDEQQALMGWLKKQLPKPEVIAKPSSLDQLKAKVGILDEPDLKRFVQWVRIHFPDAE